MGGIMSDEKRKNQNYDQEMLKCAARAIASTKGVSRVKNKTVETILSGLLNKRFKSSGIRIKRQKGAIEFDVAVVLEYGVNIPIITWMIQNNVRRAILEEFEEKVVAVNILVDDIDLPQEADFIRSRN